MPERRRKRTNQDRGTDEVKQDRSLLLYVLLSFVTFSVYHFYFMDLWAKDVNILCEKDGKHTVGVEKMMLFSVLTFGVYKYVWLAEIVDRICDNAAEYDVEVRQDSETFFVWMILVPVLGYLVAMYRAIRDTNRLAEAYERSRQKRTEVHDNPNTKPPPPCMRGRLSGLTGSLAGRSFELIPGRSVELGRNPAEVSLIVRGEKISRIHCTVQYNGKDLGFNVTDHSRNGVFVNGVRIPYNVPTYVSGKSIVALADGANKFQLIEAADEDDRSPALMKSKKIIVAALVAVAAIALAGCSPRSSMATLSTDSDSETAEVFSLAKVLNLGTNYLTSLDYDNAILQYIDIIQHDPTNKEAYAGLYAAYAAQGKADEANKVFEQAQEVFDDEADFLPGFLDDAKLVFESGGGNVPFQMLSEHFWDDLNSVFAKDVGEAWIAADPQNADPYALLGAHYAALDDESGIEKLLQNAETNGVDFNTIDAKIKTNSDGTCTLTVQINDFLKDESGQSASVSVKVDAKDNAKTVTQKVAEKAADSAASKVVEKSGLTGEAAGIANSMAQEALRKGLGSAGSGQGTESSGTVTAPTYDPSQDSGESDDFDWSQIQSEFDSLKDEFPS